MVLNKIFNEKCVEQLAWQGYEEYVRLRGLEDLPNFSELSQSERTAWIGATDRILELAIYTVKRKLEL